MADLKISQLTGVTTPLAGTEVLPIVQSSTTKKVSVADLTAGRAVSALSLNLTQGLTGGSGYQIQGFTSYRASGASASSPGDASMYYNAATGYTFQARAGSSYDWSLIDPGNNNYVLRMPTGTQNIEMAKGNLTFSTAAKGVNFTANTPAAGMTSQLLNWYEEGTYTATFTPTTSGSITLNASYNTLRYTRIGRQVTISGEIRVSSVSSPIGNVNLNLPFMAGASLCFSAFAIYDANGKTGGAITNANASTAIFSDFDYNYISASDFSGNEQLIISLTYTV